MTKSLLYYEAHITVEKPSDLAWFAFSIFAEAHGLRASRFDVDEVDHYDGAWFLSYRHIELDVMKRHIAACLKDLRQEGFNPIRWKIEDTVLDSKHGNTEESLNV